MTSKKHSGSGDIGEMKDRAVPLLKPDGRFNSVHLLPVLLNSKESSFSLAKPSIFNNEMQMSAEDRIHKLIHTREKVSVKVDKELEHSQSFRFFPKVVVFQNFLPGKVYKVPVSVRNACQIMKPLQITYEESQHFSVSFTSGLFTRIAPGMGTVLMVHFTPEDKKDYSYQISLQSNQECFKVPIFAIGPRPLLDFPDDIHIPSGPIKIRCTKVVLVRNIGDVPAIFSLSTISPFEVEPRKGVLRASEMMNVRVSVTPKKCGNIQGQLKICYETGEILYSQLYGVGEEANVWMDKSRIRIEETFIGVKQVATVTLHNDSNHLLHFKWKKMETVEDEFAEFDKLMSGYSFMRNLESQKYSKLAKGDIVDPETHNQVYNRMYDDEVRALKNEEFLFSNAHFKLRPLTGDIWPKSSLDIMVIFEPEESGEHSAVAYCDIPGHDKRLPLIISGLVKGPQFAFNLDFLDIDCVFVSKLHCYEIVVKNVGLIPGTIAFEPTRTKYGGKISCSPDALGLMPEESKTFLLTFSSNVQGEFLENILFKVIESDNILKIELKGSVVTPTLKFSVDKIDFGVVPFSFPISNIILLQNLSMVPVNYKLTIKGDGIEPSISYKQYAAAKEKPRFPKNPKEFTVIPTRGTVEAYSTCKIKITLIGNINREKKSTLVLELLDAICEHVCLPISHTVAFPTIKCSPNDINIRFCFISYPYVRTLVLENKSDVMGFFYIPNPPVYAMGTLMFSAPINHGIINAGSKIKIPITILTNSLGLQTCTVSMITLGDDSPKEICTLSGCGQGPVMTAEPHHLDYGNVDLLDTVTKEFILTNDSPVPASYSMTLTKKNSPWEIVQRSGILPAEKNIAVEVNIFLRDTGRYKDTLQIDVFGSRTLQVTLAAEGVGTSLVIFPAFCPIYDLGYVLTNKVIERNFIITNEGNRHHHITWSPLPTIKEKTSKKDEPEPIIRTLFHIEPDTMQLSGRQSAEFLIRGISEKIQQVSEEFFCHAIVASKKETLLCTKIKANFIDPKVVFSKPEIVFKVDIDPGENYKILHDNVNMTNATDLSYKIELRVESPFLLMGKNGPVSKLSFVLGSLATVELTIIFNTSCITDLYSRKFQNVLQVSYREHSHKDYLPLSGEANFPNVNIFPDILDFGCIPCGAGASETFEIANSGQLPIKYHWYWLPDGNVDYADECRKRSSRSLSAVSLSNVEEGQDDKTSATEISLDKPNDEVNRKELKPKKKKKVSKMSDDDIKAMLFPIIAQFFEEETEEQALQSLPTSQTDVDRENQYFDIAPWYGELHPFEVQTISAKFSGSEPTSQCGVLACKIEGGPTQVLLVRGEIADLEYSLDSSVVDIGYQIFCMPSTQVIKLSNVGNLPFDFSFDLSSNEVPKNETTSLKVEPIQGYLTAKQFIFIQIDFTPGLIKKINETLTLQIGFLDPVPVTLEGWGVIPQLYAFLPRPKSYVTVIDTGYEAVDFLLEEFLINEKKKKKKKKKKFEKNDELSLFGKNLSKRELNVLARNGWTVVTYEDEYPTVAEIELIVEKLLAQDHMDSCSYANMKLWRKNQCIPGLIFPPYDIDFGIVLVGSTVSYSALLYNYGPIPVTGSFQFSPKRWVLSEQGFSFKLPTISKLGADQTVSMQIFFNPRSAVYKEKKSNVEFLIYIEIACGAKIPIQVRAIVTLPYLVANVDAIDFETIKCGERKTVTITLSNEGLVPAVWRCEIKGRRSEGAFTFGFLETMTTLLPQQSVDLSIIFKPFTSGPKEAILTIVSDCIEKLEIPLTGSAVEPRVTLSDHVLKFDPTLPYPENYIKTFKVKNSGVYPIEFYLPHLDSQVMEEERILRVLCDYYETDNLCLPVRNAGDDLPKEVVSFYNKLVGMLKTVDDDGPNGQSAKKKKRRSKIDKPKFPQLGSMSQMSSVSPSQVTVGSEAPQNSGDQVEEALHENMDAFRKKLRDKNDPVKEANDAVNKTDVPQDNEPKEGMLLIFHGAPFTDSIFHARRTAKSFNLKLLSIDDIVIEAAATATYPEAIKLREKINTLYSEKAPMRISKADIKEDEGEYEDDDDDLDDIPIDDPVEEMRSKVKLILYGPKNDNQSIARGQSRKTEQPSGRASVASQARRQSQKKAVMPEATSGNIPGLTSDILEEILKRRLALRDCSQGVVIDQLTSMFFETAGDALTSILRAQGFIKYIHVFYFYNTFETYSTLFNEEKSAADEAQKLEMEKKMALLETLTVEEAEELSESDQALYWSIMMNKRKEEWLLKKNELKKGKKNKRKSVAKPDKKGGGKRASKSQTSPDSPTDGKKKDKGKKGDAKGKQKSVIQPEQESFSVDELAESQAPFATFETEYTDLITIAMNWDKKKGILNTSVNNKPPNNNNNKGRASRKSTPQGSLIVPRMSTMDSGNQSGRVSESAPEAVEDNSVVIWVFDCANPDPHKDELLISFLADNEEFTSNKPEPSFIAKPHPAVVNWCVNKPKVRQKISAPEEFIFCNYEDEIDDGADEKMNKKPKPVKRKSLKKKAEIDTKQEARKVKTRWILNPGEQVEIKIQFDPHSVGEYMFTYPIEVVGWRKPQHITVQGICDLPRIDTEPEAIFDHIVETKEPDKLYRLTFFLDSQYFDFGSILVTKQKDKRLHHIATSFNITNCSSLTAEVRFSFLDKTYAKVDTFAIEPVLLNIKPSSTDKITVFAMPRALGTFSETIVCSIKDNPAVEQIKVSCTGVKVDFEVEPKSISFDHVLVFRKDFRIIKLKNKSLVPVIWHFIGFDDAFLEQFDISSTEGLIMPLDDQDIRIEFFATQVVNAFKKVIKVEVFDEEGRGDAIHTENVQILAESVDVVVDISFSDPRKNYVEFGKAKVKSENVQEFYLKNRGKHDVTFKIETDIPANVNIPNLRKVLYVRPVYGVLAPNDKASTLEVVCNPTFEVYLYAVPIFKCYLLDGQNIVATIPIQVSVSAQWCRYEISPKPDMNFGVVPIGIKKVLPLTIKNIGVWDIAYTITKVGKFVDEEGEKLASDQSPLPNPSKSFGAEGSRGEKKSEKEGGSFSKKPKSYRVESNILRCDQFTVLSRMGTVPAGEANTIEVECYSEQEGSFNEMICIDIPDKSMDNALPDIIELVAIVRAPFIDFTSLDSIFEEHYMCDTLEDMDCPCDIHNHNIFIKSENKFLFANTCLGTPNVARLKLYNPGLIPCELNSQTRQTPSPTAKALVSSSVKSSEPAFSVKPTKLCIAPYSTEFLEVTFLPPQIGIFNGILDTSLESSIHKECKFSLQLTGEGCMPIITLIEPQQNTSSESTDLMFLPTLLGKKSTQKLEIKNTGLISCRVRLDVSDMNKSMFGIIGNEKTLSMIINESSEGIDSLYMLLTSGLVASFEVTFMPASIGKFSGPIKISIDSNPYEKIIVNLVGECYTEDITLELPSVALVGSHDGDEEDKSYQYTLAFGNCFVDTPKSTAFKIFNHSQNSVFRFKFNEDKNVNFTPKLGHVKPNSSKEITATFQSKQPVQAEKNPLLCNLEKISFPEGIPAGTSWDSRLTEVNWTEIKPEEDVETQNDFEVLETERTDKLKQRVVEPKPEPSYDPVPDSSFSIPILVSAVVAYAEYSCDVTDYEFPETLMFHSNSYSFTFKNTGTIPLTFNWNVIMDERYPLRVPSDVQAEVIVNMDSLPNHEESTPETTDTTENNNASQHFSAATSRTSRTSRTSNLIKKEPEVTSHTGTKEAEASSHGGKSKDEPIDRESFGDDVYSMSPSVTNRSQETWLSTDPIPFKVAPQYGTLNPEETISCTLTFSPTDIFDFKVIVIAMIPHLHPKLEPLKIIVKGRSLLPLCYFKTEESDYISSGRRDLSLPGPLGVSPGVPLHAETKVVEFKVIGVSGTYNKTLTAINPTGNNYSFYWENVTTPKADTVSMFYCSPMKGRIEGDGEVDTIINFIAHDTGTFESFWNFVVPEHDAKYNFLMVSHVTEPSACFLNSHIELCPTVVGLSTTKSTSLVSNEDTPLKFYFEQNSLLAVGYGTALQISPMKGKIIPGEDLAIKIQFTPKFPGNFNFHVKCFIKGMKKPLILDVTAECYHVQPVVTYESEKNNIITLDPTETNVIELGEVIVRCPQNIIFRVTNIGKTTFYYHWHYDESFMKKNKMKLVFQSRGGHITSQSRTFCTLTCTFMAKSEISDFLVTLKINKGPDYKIVFRGYSTRPNYVFSSLECNFGLCFFKESSQFVYKKSISIKNKDSTSILIECLFENTPYFALENASGPIQPEEEKEFFVSFSPQGVQKYEEVAEFIINGCTKQKFKILGEGIDIEVGLLSPHNKLILFAPVLPGGNGFACAPVVNNSKSEVAVEFFCGKNEFGSHSTLEGETAPSTPNTRTTQAEIGTTNGINPFEITPSSVVFLKPRELVNLCVRFRPTVRTKLITEKVYMRILDHTEPLCILEGSCVGPDFTFDRYCVAFGGVLRGCSTQQKLKLINSGEVGARFKWESGEWDKTFRITPTKGYSSPDTETTFSIVFCPNSFDKCIRCVAVCSIDDYPPMRVNLTGACWEEPIAKENITFSVPVRSQDKKTIPISNKSATLWEISPRLTGQYFYGSDIIRIPPHSTSDYEVTYTPLVMTVGNITHKGSVVFCIPEGQAIAYELIGTADKPLSAGKINGEIHCKESHTELIPISNWLTTSQRFEVSNEVGKFDKFDPVVEISGNKFIDVPGKTEREYRWTVFCYKECTLNIKVYFKNIESKEYLFYELVLKVLKSRPLDHISLCTPVRQSVTHKINVQNPLGSDVNFTMHSSSPDIQCKTPVLVPAYSKSVPVTIKYTPLFIGESTVSVDLQCSELGNFPYKLDLKALPPVPENLLKCSTSVGQSTTMEAPICNLTKSKAEFTCKIDQNDHRDFDTDKQVTLAGNSQGSVNITFEPTTVGNISATLKISSHTAGEFEFPLLGNASEPAPQGPFSIKMGGSITIAFKNIFHDKQTFTYEVDNPLFTIKASNEGIRPKKDTRIVISFPKTSEPVSSPVTGKLTIFSTTPSFSNIKWIYYLKGVDAN